MVQRWLVWYYSRYPPRETHRHGAHVIFAVLGSLLAASACDSALDVTRDSAYRCLEATTWSAICRFVQVETACAQCGRACTVYTQCIPLLQHFVCRNQVSRQGCRYAAASRVKVEEEEEEEEEEGLRRRRRLERLCVEAGGRDTTQHAY